MGRLARITLLVAIAAGLGMARFSGLVDASGQLVAVHGLVSKMAGQVGIPLIGFAFPLVGLFIAPIYPLLNSAVLSALPKSLHSPMTGWIVIFSALGGTLGSRIIGYLFKNVGAESAFYYTLIPMVLPISLQLALMQDQQIIVTLIPCTFHKIPLIVVMLGLLLLPHL